MKLVIYSDDEKARSPIVQSALKYGFDLHVATGKYRWYKDLETRTRKTLEVLESFDPEELVVVTDGHDVFVNNNAEEFKKHYREHYDGKIVFQSEHQNCRILDWRKNVFRSLLILMAIVFFVLGCMLGLLHSL